MRFAQLVAKRSKRLHVNGDECVSRLVDTELDARTMDGSSGCCTIGGVVTVRRIFAVRHDGRAVRLQFMLYGGAAFCE